MAPMRNETTREPIASVAHAAPEHGQPPTDATTCCVVGGGPAGAVLALLLARQGVSVVLLEAHMDFDRDFRGDTLHPSVMEILDDLGLARRVLALPHGEVHRLTLSADGRALPV